MHVILRRLLSWHGFQVVLMMALTAFVAWTTLKYLKPILFLSPDATDNELTLRNVYDDLSYDNIPKECLDLQKQGGYFSGKSGTKLRTIAKADMLPESLPDWDPNAEEVPVNRYPKVLLVGFSKCGTSALLTFLNVHPNIVSLDYEIDYFCDRVYFKYSLHWYRMRMPLSTSNQVTLEKSPCYSMDPKALDRILAFNSSIKVMVIVRDPYTRILSEHGQYLAAVNNFGKDEQTIEERYFDRRGNPRTYPLLKWGTYNERIERLYTKIQRENILLIDGDMFIRNPLPVLKEIEHFLRVPSYFSNQDVYLDPEKGFYCPRERHSMKSLCMSENKGRQHVTPSLEFRKKVLDFLRPYSLQFFEQVGRKFNWTLS